MLKVNATVTAEAVGISHVTLHRIEKGEPSVAIGGWVNTASAWHAIGHSQRKDFAYSGLQVINP